ncbi:MAG: hypothetical protein N2037_03440 [Acidimicrobiales bacterium]|nr:hypothetical protein [Acidimicrobiales bacterium]
MTDRHRTTNSIDGVLDSLPDEFAVASDDDLRLVIGPSGAFVLSISLAGNSPDLNSLAERVSQRTAATRSILADHLTWVPFIDGVVVGNGTALSRAPVTVIPFDLLHETITEGRELIASTTISQIRDLLRRGLLGSWRIGVGSTNGKIDLCDPAPTTTIPHS